MFWYNRRPHHDSKSNGLKSLRSGLGGELYWAYEDDVDEDPVEQFELESERFESYGFSAITIFHAKMKLREMRAI